MKKISKKEAIKKALRNETCFTCAYAKNSYCTFYSTEYWIPFPKERTCRNWCIIKAPDYSDWMAWLWDYDEWGIFDKVWFS
jgi:hypothetical protein